MKQQIEPKTLFALSLMDEELRGLGKEDLATFSSDDRIDRDYYLEQIIKSARSARWIATATEKERDAYAIVQNVHKTLSARAEKTDWEAATIERCEAVLSGN